MFTNSHGHLTQIAKKIEQASFKTTSKPISTKIISDTPGRLRLRISPPHRHPREMQSIANVLNAQSYVSQVRTNINSGSMIINHDGKNATLENVLTTLLDLGVTFADITEGNSEAAEDVKRAVINLNKRFEQATSGEVDLRFLFPLGLSMLAVRQILVKGLQLEIIPWYVLAWYAFDSFMKLNSNSQLQLNTEP
ncbi:HMA2 domain-containing protein [Anabaena sp. CCY 0017]|uniref:HMA2 domain-containing protein n=1 Tax=Anabaena sp. CCY 0017 TaxID=3103866 RepID=UPI0039C6762B